MRSAGCIWNDISDADIDPYVERTASRPIASGAISIKHAFGLFAAMMFAAAIIAWQLPTASLLLCFVAAGLTLLYPLTKRFFSAPQLFLGLAFAMAVPIAFSACNQLNNPLWPMLYVAALIWPLIYDTIYALSDQKDDALLGIHSLPLALKHHTMPFIDYCQILFIFMLILIGKLDHARPFYYLGILCYGILAFKQHVSLRSNHPSFQNIFRSYQWLGALIMLSFILGL